MKTFQIDLTWILKMTLLPPQIQKSSPLPNQTNIWLPYISRQAGGPGIGLLLFIENAWLLDL